MNAKFLPKRMENDPSAFDYAEYVKHMMIKSVDAPSAKRYEDLEQRTQTHQYEKG